MKRVKALVSLLLCAALMAPATTSAFAAADYTVQPQSAAHLTALSSAASGVLQKVLSVPATAQEPAAGETAESARDKEETLKAQEEAAAGKLPPADGMVDLELLPRENQRRKGDGCGQSLGKHQSKRSRIRVFQFGRLLAVQYARRKRPDAV